ncbi:uncharacterized protein LOC123317652 [Coccinella septempunctata]|uniref:uncharacterized protein LOC123317652 n=1 Tax=Coccinella septempunctata TaxID=41139 RepID=UPI001D0846E9|nr:uncharacterized protein LOC123317652 [Coccinella septempunctata]
MWVYFLNSSGQFLNDAPQRRLNIFCERSKLQYPTSIHVLNGTVRVEADVRFLGLVLDKHLKWGPHIEQLRSRLNSTCYALFMLRSQVDFELLKLVYYANFHSLISYGIIFWGCSTHVDTIFVTQKRALRTMLRLGYRASCRGLFKGNNILTVYGVYIYKLLIFFSKNNHYFRDFRNLNNTRSTFSSGGLFTYSWMAVLWESFEHNLAEIIMDELVSSVMATLTFMIPFFWLYVDDSITAIPEGCPDIILEAFNSFHSKIQFTIEREENMKITFLDVEVQRTESGELKKNWYIKPTNSDGNWTMEELASILKDWVVNTRKKDGSEFEEDTVKTKWNLTSK